MLLLGQELTKRGIECEYWFCKPSNRLQEFTAAGPTTLAPLWKLAERLERGDFDVVHMTASDEVAPLVARIAGTARVVVTARGALAEGWNHSNCFAYTAVSKGMAEVNQPYTDLQIDVVRNAIDVSRFAPPARVTGGPPIVAFVGRTTDHVKDFPRFTRIAHRLRDLGVRLWIADPHEASWEKFTKEPVEQMPVERWGRVSHEEIPGFYRDVAASGGVVVMTSRSEGFGNVAPEAAASGARVAAPNVMGLREAIIDSVTGRLFPADASDDDVAAMLRAWLAEPHDMAACARAACAEFSATRLADQFIEIYSRLEPRRAPAVTRSVEFREQALLVDHLAKQRQHRARAAREAALEYSSEGFADLAISALAAAFRNAPRQFATRAGSRQLFGTLRRLVRRSSVRRFARKLTGALPSAVA
jgi:hypothetical protein